MQEQPTKEQLPVSTDEIKQQTPSQPRTSQLQRDYAYYREIFRAYPMPFAYLDLDLLDQNIALIAANAGNKHIRLASKSLRSLAVLRHIFSAHPCFRGVMCFSTQEAVYLAEQGFDDLLIGYPAFNEHDLTAVAKAVKKGAHIICMVDSTIHVERLEQIAQQQDIRLPVCLEFDMSMDIPGLHFGVWRSPLRTPEQARPVIERIQASSYVYLNGFMGYEAQIAGVGDNMPGNRLKNSLIRVLKQRSLRQVTTRRAAVAKLLQEYAIKPRFVNGGGTGSLASTRAEEVVTEVTVGSGFYAPALFDYYRDFRYQPAAGFAIEIVRQPSPNRYTCLGGGYIASGATGSEKQPKPYLPAGAKLEAFEGAGEVQTPIVYTGPERLQIGDPIFLRHSKAGELCERFTHLLLVSHGAVIDKITTYRGDGHCFI